mgnify:CR=1 FL=1
MKWSKEEEQLLMLWKEQGWTTKEIANELDTQVQTVYSKLYRMTHREELNTKKAQYYLDNKEELLNYNRKYTKQWKVSNSGKSASYQAKRRAAELQAVPAWSETLAIEEFYELRPEGYHIDHIVPLQGVNICGLHVLCNLQYLTAQDNLSKGNRFDAGATEQGLLLVQ